MKISFLPNLPTLSLHLDKLDCQRTFADRAETHESNFALLRLRHLSSRSSLLLLFVWCRCKQNNLISVRSEYCKNKRGDLSQTVSLKNICVPYSPLPSPNITIQILFSYLTSNDQKCKWFDGDLEKCFHDIFNVCRATQAASCLLWISRRRRVFIDV